MKVHLPIHRLRLLTILLIPIPAWAGDETASKTMITTPQDTLPNPSEIFLLTSGNDGVTHTNGTYIRESMSTPLSDFLDLVDYEEITFKENHFVDTSGVSVQGGAIFATTGGNMNFENSGSVTFIDNMAMCGKSCAQGGAIYAGGSSAFTFNRNESLAFEKNRAYSPGYSNYYIYSSSGGAIFSDSSAILTFSDNGIVKFSENRATGAGNGGAIMAYGLLTFTCNTHLIFAGNTIDGSWYSGGGAISAVDETTFSMNGIVEFSENAVNVSGSGNPGAQGGAISTGSSKPLILSGNNSVVFRDNMVTAEGAAQGGAIYTSCSPQITISDNGTVSFSGNSSQTIGNAGCAYGGAIDAWSAYSCDVSILVSSNDAVAFNGNTTKGEWSTRGGAISVTGNSGTDSITFSGRCSRFYDLKTGESSLTKSGHVISLNLRYR